MSERLSKVWDSHLYKLRKRRKCQMQTVTYPCLISMLPPRDIAKAKVRIVIKSVTSLDPLYSPK